MANGQSNLGNDLYITEIFDARLSKDTNQNTPKNLPMDYSANGSKGNLSLLLISINDRKSLSTSSFYFKKFMEANKIMEDTFAIQSIEADLGIVFDMGFSVEIAMEKLSEVVCGAVLYIYMEKYLWIEEIVVKPEYQRHGVGKTLMQRMMEIAHLRKKDVLLYGIEQAYPFYQALGFREMNRYSTKFKNFKGKYLTWESP